MNCHVNSCYVTLGVGTHRLRALLKHHKAKGFLLDPDRIPLCLALPAPGYYSLRCLEYFLVPPPSPSLTFGQGQFCLIP